MTVSSFSRLGRRFSGDEVDGIAGQQSLPGLGSLRSIVKDRDSLQQRALRRSGKKPLGKVTSIDNRDLRFAVADHIGNLIR